MAEDDDLKFDLIVSVSVLGAVCLILICAVTVLIFWNFVLARKIKNLDPFLNFKIQRPKVESAPGVDPRPPSNSAGYDNLVFIRDSDRANAGRPERRDLNPIAARSKLGIDNGNFIFGNSSSINSKMLANSRRNANYLDLDEKFY